MNGEYVCELVRAHNDKNDARFAIILSQIVDSETRKGNHEVANRLRELMPCICVQRPAWGVIDCPAHGVVNSDNPWPRT